MCLFGTPSTPEPEKYKESAQSKSPDNAAVMTAASRRTSDRIRAMTPTILTSGNGDLNASSTQTDKTKMLGG